MNNITANIRALSTAISLCTSLALMLSLSPTQAQAASSALASQQQQMKRGHTYPKIKYGTGQRASRIAHGEYLVKMGDCIACHTDKKGGAPFSGGLPFKTPFGTFYSQNITSDPTTGIGSWTDDEFIHSMRDGVRPDKAHHFPVYPYLYFNKITTADLKDIKAYLNVIPPVHRQNTKNEVPFPFSWRFGQTFWKLMFFDFYKGQIQADPKQSDLWNRGSYIVNGLGHCGMCHTPINTLGGPKRKHFLQGAMIDGFYAPNITGPNLNTWSLNQIVHMFETDTKLGGKGRVQGPMTEVINDSLQYLKHEDLLAIATYLKSVKGEPIDKKPHGQLNADSGKNVYNSHCAVCHSTGAGGAPKLSDHENWAMRVKEGVATLHDNAIHGLNAMPPKGSCMTCGDNEIIAAVDYMVAKASSIAGSGPKITAAAPKRLTLDDGKKIYQEVCQICHNKGVLNAPKISDHSVWASRAEKNFDILVGNVIHGYRNMPRRGACNACSNAEISAAVKYMLKEGTQGGDYRLW